LSQNLPFILEMTVKGSFDILSVFAGIYLLGFG